MEISMPTVMIKYALPEEDAEMKLALKASSYQQVLYRMSQEIFRPARKHGYDNAKLQALMNDNPRLNPPTTDFQVSASKQTNKKALCP